MKKIFFLLAIIVNFSRQVYAAGYDHAQKNYIKKAISEMLTKTENPFVIVQINQTEKFIQFYHDDGGLLIDFPNVDLTSTEVRAASKYFNKYGIELQDVSGTDPKTMKENVIKSWTNTYSPQQIDAVVNVALGALFEIYGIKPSTSLTIIKGWE